MSAYVLLYAAFDVVSVQARSWIFSVGCGIWRVGVTVRPALSPCFGIGRRAWADLHAMRIRAYRPCGG